MSYILSSTEKWIKTSTIGIFCRVISPATFKRGENTRLVSRIHIIDDRFVFVRGVEFHAIDRPIWAGEPVTILIREAMEIKFNDQILDVWDAEDAKWQLEQLEDSRIINSDLVKNIINSIQENLALALTDPSPYTRYVANYLARKENGKTSIL